MATWTIPATKGKSGGEYEKCPAGNHPAVLVAIIDMGTQEVEAFEKGGPSKMQHRAMFVWELVGKKISGSGKNHVIGIDLNVSLNEKAKLRAWLEARRGSPIPDGAAFDVTSELGQACLLNVVANAAGWPKISGVSAVPEGLTVPKHTYGLTATRVEDYVEAGAVVIPDWVPWLYGEHLSDVIRRCQELKGMGFKPSSAGSQQAPAADTIPFGAPATTGTPTPPPRKPRPAPEPSFFFAPSDAAEPKLMTVSEIKAMVEQQGGVDMAVAEVCKPGSDDWTPLTTAIPESQKWVPF